MEIFVGIIVWLVLIIIAEILIRKKNRNGYHWGISMLLFAPLTVLVLLALPTLKSEEEIEAERNLK